MDHPDTITTTVAPSTPTREFRAVNALPVGAVARIRFRRGDRVHRTNAHHYRDTRKHYGDCRRSGYRTVLTLDPVDCSDCLSQYGDHWPDVTEALIEECA